MCSLEDLMEPAREMLIIDDDVRLLEGFGALDDNIKKIHLF